MPHNPITINIKGPIPKTMCPVLNIIYCIWQGMFHKYSAWLLHLHDQLDTGSFRKYAAALTTVPQGLQMALVNSKQFFITGSHSQTQLDRYNMATPRSQTEPPSLRLLHLCITAPPACHGAQHLVIRCTWVTLEAASDFKTF